MAMDLFFNVCFTVITTWLGYDNYRRDNELWCCTLWICAGMWLERTLGLIFGR